MTDFPCKRLSQLRTGADIVCLSAAVSPGSHCPLFGVVMSAPFIRDLTVLVIGEAECCWNAYHHHRTISGAADNFFTYSMDDLDTVYGAGEGIVRAVQALYARHPSQAVMLVSSCIPELTGEDLEAIAADCRLPVPVLTAHTSHYNSTGYYTGISHFYSGLLPLVEKNVPKTSAVAILGARYPGLEAGEIPNALRQAGFSVSVPGSVRELAALSGCAMTLVADVTALPLAQALEDRFQVPFVRIDHLLCPDRILDAYRRIDQLLGTGLTPAAEKRACSLENRMTALRQRWDGRPFVAAVPFCLPFEVCRFFTKLGMTPLWLAARDLYPGDRALIDGLVRQGIDCPVFSFASLHRGLALSADLRPALAFGFFPPDRLETTVINPAPCTAMSGFSFPDWVLDRLEEAEGGKNGT